MSYQVLARKWRPQNFNDITGQEHVTRALQNAIASERVPHALLLCGPRGVGKTTIARIVARCLNCDRGPSETPCGECPACLDIATGASTDVQEVDAASRTSVDDVRDLIESVRYAAAPGKRRIFIVDEVHMLSTPAFNALLKTLEEPPPGSLFIFATTNPEKIPFTVLSRCQRHDLRRIPSVEITQRLRDIAKAEALAISERSLAEIAREGDGSLRDALTLLDQVVAVAGGGEVSDEQVGDILDLIDRRLLLAIAAACIEGDPAEALHACARAAEAGIEAQRLGAAMLGVFRDLVVVAVSKGGQGLVDANDAELAELVELAAKSDVGRLRRMFRALLKEQEDLAWAPTPGAVLEMAVVRLASLAPGSDVEQLLARLDAVEANLRGNQGSGSGTGGGNQRSDSEPSKAPRKQPSKPTKEARSEPQASEVHQGRDRQATIPPAKPPASDRKAGARSEPQASEVHQERERQATNPPAELPASDRKEGARSEPQASEVHQERQRQPKDSPTDPITTPPADQDLATRFQNLCAFILQEERGLGVALQGGTPVACEPGSVRVEVEEAFAAHRLERRRRDLENLFERFFSRTTLFTVAGPDAQREEGGASNDRDRRAQLRRDALDRPSINRALEVLGGEIVSIRPLGGDQ